MPSLSRVIAVDPALSHRFLPDPLADLPFARDVGPSGSNLAARIPGASFTTIAPAWYFSFLGLCTPDPPQF